MGSMGDLGKDMKAKADRVADNADRLVRRCALAIDAAVVLATPVDTGRARANWQVEIGAVPTGVVEPTDKSGASAINKAKDTIASYNGNAADKSVYITNNLPYIERLNDGWSAQAPAGFVETAVQVGIAAIQAEVANVVDGKVQEGSK